jgi:hypothetical protein
MDSFILIEILNYNDVSQKNFYHINRIEKHIRH